MAEAPVPNLFALPPGADFAEAFVDGLIQRQRAAPPEAMARVRVFLNTERMRRRVIAAFQSRGAGFLPRLSLVSDLGDDPALCLGPASDSLARRLMLMRLIAPLLRGAAASGSPVAPEAALFDVADGLATLADEMQGEGVGLDRLERLETGVLSAHWQRSLAFLRVISPILLDEASPEARRRRAVAALARLWAEIPPADPVIVAGSTGSRGTTQALMRLVAGLRTGAVVLPGLDPHMPADVWDHLRDDPLAEDHPQFRFALLAQALGVHPRDIRPWPHLGAGVPAPDRAALISLALRPAPVTDQWLRDAPRLGPTILPHLQGLSLIEAPDPKAEALAIAVLMRASVAEGRRTALISPDRVLTRRVAAALDRWGLRADDSAGIPLNQTAPGRLLRLLAHAMAEPLPADRLIVLLSHPLAATGRYGRGDHLLLVREMELHLRRKGPLYPTAEGICHWAAAKGADPLWTDWIAGLMAALQPLPETLPLVTRTIRHRMVAEVLCRGPGPDQTGAGALWSEDPGAACLALMDRLQAAAGDGDMATAPAYGALFDALISREEVRDTVLSHPLLSIWGTLEARVERPDRVILAGLNEGIWPKLPAPDPWMNRLMRREAGLLLPDRQIGLSAHDFQQAMGAGEVILSRSRRDADAPTVPSRWVNRIVNLVEGLKDQRGPVALAAMRARGQRWLDLASRLDRPEAPLAPAPRPSPSPPGAARPRELPVTAIETLIRDPYAVYASHILRLRALRPLRPGPDPRDRGTFLHSVLADFARSPDFSAPPDQARAALLSIAETRLRAEVPSPAQRLEWLARLERAAPSLIAFDRQVPAAPALAEKEGRLRLDPLDFTLRARPDRIDRLEDDRYRIIDFKTGSLPSEKQIEAFRKQLLLTAIMAESGAFADLGPVEVASVSYLRIGDGGPVERSLPSAKMELGLARERARLITLIRRYLETPIGFTARRAPEHLSDASDYDHLSRFGEWDDTSPATTLPVGPRDE